MDRTYQHIFTPLTIRGITLKNRIEIAPISVFDLDTTPERHPSERDMQFFRMRAMGGAAVVTLGDCIVDPTGEDSGKLASPKIMAGHEDNLPFLTRIADEIHRYGAVASIELNHAGMLRASAGVRPGALTTSTLTRPRPSPPCPTSPPPMSRSTARARCSS